MKLTLFAKIFGGFWLTTVAVAVAVAWSTYQLLAVRSDRPLQEHLEQAQVALAEAAKTVYEARGLDGLRHWIAQLNTASLPGGPLFLLDAEGRSLPGSPPLPPVFLSEGHVELPLRLHGLRLLKLELGADGPLWLASAPRRLRPPHFAEGPFGPDGPEFGVMRLAVAVLVSGAICWLLARHLTRPIRELQAASTRLADGNFTIDISHETLARRDELAALARDFTRMAEHLKAQIEAQRQLLRDVSHELRSPLARLQVAAALARRRAGNDIDSEIDRIELETARLDELIGQLLALMRIESGAATANMALVDLSALLDAVVRDARYEAEGRGVGVDASVTPSLEVQGNLELLRSAFDNVVRNALRHTAPGTTVAITAAREPGVEALRISVCDRGPGVDPTMLERIFEPFMRTDEARNRDAGGAGLGLAIAREAVRAHRGTICARNRPDGGLEVAITLPGERPVATRG